MINFPDLQDLNNRVLEERELQQQIWDQKTQRKETRQKFLFKSHLLLGNGGFIKLKTTNGICSGTQAKLVLGNTLKNVSVVKRYRKECPHCEGKGMPL